jgi:hypothetical protein
MPFIAVYDANVLYPNTLRDLLIRIAQLPHVSAMRVSYASRWASMSGLCATA